MSIQPLTQDLQEAVLRNRMTIDERPLRRLIKKFSAVLAPVPGSSSSLSVSTDAAQPQEGETSTSTTEEQQEQLSLSLASFAAESISYRTLLQRLLSVSSSTLPLETQQYDAELHDIMEAQKTAQVEIAELKATLASAKLQRKQKLDYDAVASSIQTLPPRQQISDGLEALQNTVGGLKDERANLQAVSDSARGRVRGMVDVLEALVKDVGEEVGMRERREVQREEAEGDHDVEADADADAEALREEDADQAPDDADGAADAAATSATVDGGNGIPRSRSTLNAAAAPFRPQPSTSGQVAGTSSSKRASKRREPASDEEGQLDDSSSAAGGAGKRPRTAEGEEGQVDSQSSRLGTQGAGDEDEGEEAEEGEEEEEEGSLEPATRAAPSAARGRSRGAQAPPRAATATKSGRLAATAAGRRR